MSARKNSLEQAPYSKTDGRLLDYTGHGAWAAQHVEWRPNDPFEATLVLTGTERGRSSAVFVWRNVAGGTYRMFLTDMLEVAQTLGVEQGGRVTAMWKVRKRGTNYGLALA